MLLEVDNSESLKVIPLNPEIAKELEIKRKAAAKRPCAYKHRNVVVWEEKRTVECSDCGYVLDPFDYINHWAKDGEHRMQGLKRIEILRKIAQAEHDDLMRKIKNLREQLKRRGQPQPDVERSRYQSARWNPEKADQIIDPQND